MRKINSIRYGGKIVAAACLFLIVIPLSLLAIELRQDKKMDNYYQKHSYAKIDLGNGKYECQSCGSREVTAHDTVCRVCGTRFKEEK